MSAEGKASEEAVDGAEKALEDSRGDGERERLQRGESAMESVLPTVKSYRAKIRELDACREEYRAAVSACTEKSSELERLTAEGKSAEEKLAAMPEPDIDEYFRNCRLYTIDAADEKKRVNQGLHSIPANKTPDTTERNSAS